MKTTIIYENKNYHIDLSQPLDISIPITGKKDNVNAWYVKAPTIEPHREANFTGSILAGSSTNFYDISFNPHAHGTHTECVGHISKEHQSVNQNLREFFFMAEVITITPLENNQDLVITKEQLETALKNKKPKALVIRTRPNLEVKIHRQYSNTNPPYFLNLQVAPFENDASPSRPVLYKIK